MTSSIYLFASNNILKDNTANKTAAIGELSPFCRSYAPDVLEYSTTAYPDVEIQIFDSHNDAGVVPLVSLQTDRLLEITNWFYDHAKVIPTNYSQNDYAIALTNRFSNFVSEVVVSKFVSNGTHLIPRSVSFRLTVGAGTQDAIVTMWFANEAFETEYQLYTIRVQPPLKNLDDLFKPYAAVKALVDAIKPQTTMEAIEVLKNKQPNTRTVAVTTNWIDPQNSKNVVPLVWYAVVYGEGGNTSDNINNALRDYIQDHSTNAIESWKVVLPDLFRNTHFLVLPRWDRFAIPQRPSIPGIYNPTSSLRETKTFTLSRLPDYSSEEIDNFTSFTYHPYRSISLVIVAGKDNRAGAQVFEQHITDYIGQEAINGEDFQRQSALTQEWVTMMGNLIRAAEKQAINAAAPSGMRAFRQGGLAYLSKKLDNVEYMVAIRANYGA